MCRRMFMTFDGLLLSISVGHPRGCVYVISLLCDSDMVRHSSRDERLACFNEGVRADVSESGFSPRKVTLMSCWAVMCSGG